jgi:hypothetical protein
VTNLRDDGSPGSLRYEVQQANTTPGPDVVRFAHGLHGTIALDTAWGQINITDAVTVNGPGADQVTVSGQDASRVFAVGSGVKATLAGLTIAHGKAAMGGGIDNAGALTVRDSILSDNQAAGGAGGGGIVNEAAAGLTLDHSLLNNNQATAGAGADVFGGGLLNYGSATVTSSAFSGNKALGGTGPAGDFFAGSVGGAIDNFGGATLTVAGSTFTTNQAVGAAGPYFGIGGRRVKSASSRGSSMASFHSPAQNGDPHSPPVEGDLPGPS